MTGESCLYPSIMWNLGIKLRLTGLVASALPTEPSHQTEDAGAACTTEAAVAAVKVSCGDPEKRNHI